MSVTVETLENLERKVVLSLPWSEINAETDKRLQQTQRRVKIDGFRPGKAPMKMVESMYGAGVQNDVMNDRVQKAIYDIAVSEDLRVAGMPRFEGVDEQDDKEAFKVAAIFEVFPEVTVGDLSAQEVEKVTAEVGDAEIDKTIEILRQQRTRFNHVEREAQNGDRVIIDFEGKIDGTPFDGGASQNYPFVLGNGQMLPEFEAGVLGLKAGESKDVEVNFPEDYHGKDVAGKTAVFTITLTNVSEATLPEVDEQFAKALGIADGDVAKMREEVKANLEREVKRRIQARIKERVMNVLIETHPIEVPKALVQQESQQLAENAKRDFEARGMQTKDLPIDASWFGEQAARRVKLGLIMSELVKSKELHAKPEQIRATIEDFAASYEDPSEVIGWYYSQPQRLAQAEALVIEDNVVEWVITNAKTTDVATSFDDLMGNAA